MKALLIALSLATAITASDSLPVIYINGDLDNSSYTNRIMNQISEIILNTNDYRVTSDISLKTSHDVLVRELSGAFDSPVSREVGRYLPADRVINFIFEERFHDNALTIIYLDPQTAQELDTRVRRHIDNIDNILTYDLYDLVMSGLYDKEYNTREIHDSLSSDMLAIKEEVSYNNYNIDIEKRWLYFSIGVGYLVGSEKGVGPSIGFHIRDDYNIGINYQLISKTNLSDDIDEDLRGYYTYETRDTLYTVDYEVLRGYSHDFYLTIGGKMVSVLGGVSIDTYITDTEAMNWSNGGDYGPTDNANTRFSSVGWNLGLSLTPKGKRAYYIFSLLYRRVANHSLVMNLSIEI